MKEKDVKVLYLCDRKKCGGNCSEECKHTDDICHGVNYAMSNFEKFEDEESVYYFEKEETEMTGNEYQKLAARTINGSLHKDEKEMHAVFGMCSEVGELHGLYQKKYQGHEISDEHIMKELGDLMWFVAEYCTVKGWDLEYIMRLNIDKLRARYPEGFEEEKSLHRKENDI